MRLATPPLERGTYTITWAVVGDDGHPTSGTITFGAGLRPAGATPEVTTGPGPWGAALRLADLGGLLVAIGAVAVCGRVLRRPRRRRRCPASARARGGCGRRTGVGRRRGGDARAEDR